MPKVKIEVQRRKCIDTVATLDWDVPSSVLLGDDPDALADWVLINVPSEALDRVEIVEETTAEITGADNLSDRAPTA